MNTEAYKMPYDRNKQVPITQTTTVIQQELCWIICGRHRVDKVSEHSSSITHKEVIGISIFNRWIMKQMKMAQETRTKQ